MNWTGIHYYHNIRGYQACIPKPIISLLDDPTKLTFLLKGKTIIIKNNECINNE